MSEDLVGAVPDEAVADELRAVLRADTSRVGDTFRGLEEGLSPREIADRLGVPTHGFHYNNLLIIEALLKGRVSQAPVRRRVVRQRLASYLATPGLSPAAHAHLQAVADSYQGDSAIPPHTWDTFLSWSEMLMDAEDIGAIEDAFKIEVAGRLAAVREAMMANDPSWAEQLRRVLLSSGLVHWTVVDDLTKALAALPDRGESVIRTVWDPEPAAHLIDDFDAALREAAGVRKSQGSVLSVGSVLLMARDLRRFVPFRATVAQEWRVLTTSPAPKPATLGERYEQMLTWLDEYLEHSQAAGLDIADRLVAHGLAWTVARTAPPETWPESVRTQFRAWRGESVEPPRAWLIRPKKTTVELWLDAGYVSMAATYLGEVPPGATRDEIKGVVDAKYENVEYVEKRRLTDEYYAFLSRIRADDWVCTQAGGRLHVGRISGEPWYESSAEDRLRCEVDWLADVPSQGLPEPLPALLDQQGTLVELPDAADTLGALVDTAEPEPATEPGSGEIETPIPAALPVQLPAVTPALAASLHMETGPLQDIVELLASRRQVVLYGPPGTGKTYLALALARHLVGADSPSHQQLVQFHPSYSYEDFFEGYRPAQTASGHPTFEIVPGPLRRIAEDARLNPDQPFVLIIDEMNRANLAKVFGELYFLLEYRKHSVQLQYRPEKPFQLPANLYLIGTMNTADRSIALLDAAMRRRFAFVELHPDEPPVRDVLANYLAANHRTGDPRVELLAALNAAIEDTDRDFKIGPSYLMRAEAENTAGLAEDLASRHPAASRGALLRPADPRPGARAVRAGVAAGWAGRHHCRRGVGLG